MARPGSGPDPAESQLPLWAAASEPADQASSQPDPAARDQAPDDDPTVSAPEAAPPPATLAPAPPPAPEAAASLPDQAVPTEHAPGPPVPQRPAGPPPRNGGRPGLRLGSGPGARPAPGRGGPPRRSASAGGRGPLTLARSNLQVLDVLARLDPDRPLNAGQRAALEQWAGWGPMAKAFDPYERTPAWQQLGARLRELLTPEEGTAAQQATATSFYTSPTVTAAIWRVLVGLGFAGGQVLEPGCGSGLFIAAAPAGLPIA